MSIEKNPEKNLTLFRPVYSYGIQGAVDMLLDDGMVWEKEFKFCFIEVRSHARSRVLDNPLMMFPTLACKEFGYKLVCDLLIIRSTYSNIELSAHLADCDLKILPLAFPVADNFVSKSCAQTNSIT